MLTKKTKYALKALEFLAKNYSIGLPISSDVISNSNNISKKFLESILSDLKKAGILSSVHGKGGGYFLRRAPVEITLIEVVRLFDGAIGLIPCVTFQYFEPCGECSNIDNCKIRSTFKELRDRNVEFLKSKTLNDLI